jgi:hypothetical protein
MSLIVSDHYPGLADCPTELHKVVPARLLLRQVEPADSLFPRSHRLAGRNHAFACSGPVLARYNKP